MLNGAFELQYGVSLAVGMIKDIIDDSMPLRYLPKQPRSSYILYVRFDRLMKKNGNVWPLL